jgi:hypothetical protein
MMQMRMRQQLIIVAAVVFATVAVGVNVYASTRSADQRSQQLAQVIPVASILDRGVFDVPPSSDSSDESTRPGYSNTPYEPCGPPNLCSDPHAGDAANPALSNHGFNVSSFAAHIGSDTDIDGPLGALVRVIARSNVERDDPPRSDRAEERRNTEHPSPPTTGVANNGKGQSDKDR